MRKIAHRKHDLALSPLQLIRALWPKQEICANCSGCDMFILVNSGKGSQRDYHSARGMPRLLSRLPKSHTRQLHSRTSSISSAAVTCKCHCWCATRRRRSCRVDYNALHGRTELPYSHQWPKASCSRNDASKLANIRSKRCCSHQVLGIRTKLQNQKQLAQTVKYCAALLRWTATLPVR